MKLTLIGAVPLPAPYSFGIPIYKDHRGNLFTHRVDDFLVLSGFDPIGPPLPANHIVFTEGEQREVTVGDPFPLIAFNKGKVWVGTREELLPERVSIEDGAGPNFKKELSLFFNQTS